MDSTSLKILEIYQSRQSLTIQQLAIVMNVDPLTLSEPVLLLLNRNYLRAEPSYVALHTVVAVPSLDTPLEITFPGKAAIEYEKKLSKKERVNKIRYVINTALSLLAIIISALALLSELGLIQLSQP